MCAVHVPVCADRGENREQSDAEDAEPRHGSDSCDSGDCGTGIFDFDKMKQEKKGAGWGKRRFFCVKNYNNNYIKYPKRACGGALDVVYYRKGGVIAVHGWRRQGKEWENT